MKWKHFGIPDPLFNVFPWSSLIHTLFLLAQRKPKHTQSLFLCEFKPKKHSRMKYPWTDLLECNIDWRSSVCSFASSGSFQAIASVSASPLYGEWGHHLAQQFPQMWTINPRGPSKLFQENPWGQNYSHNNTYHKK